MHRIRHILPILAASVLAVAVASPLASARPAANESNIVQTGEGRRAVQDATSLLAKAGLAATLQGKGPFTVFAPTDAAFAKVPKATLAALAADPAKLKAVLLYHVVKGDVTCTRSSS